MQKQLLKKAINWWQDQTEIVLFSNASSKNEKNFFEKLVWWFVLSLRPFSKKASYQIRKSDCRALQKSLIKNKQSENGSSRRCPYGSTYVRRASQKFSVFGFGKNLYWDFWYFGLLHLGFWNFPVLLHNILCFPAFQDGRGTQILD